MRLLLDSHAVYWWMTGNARLSAVARELILDGANVVLVSAVSIYEYVRPGREPAAAKHCESDRRRARPNSNK